MLKNFDFLIYNSFLIRFHKYTPVNILSDMPSEVVIFIIKDIL